MLIVVNCDGKKVHYEADSNVHRLQWLIEDFIKKNAHLQLNHRADEYALRTPGDSGEYLSDNNFTMYLRENVELVLKLSPKKEATEAVFALHEDDDQRRKKMIFSLSKQFLDAQFAREFVNKNGVSILVDFIAKGTGNNQAYALAAMQALINHNDVAWGTFDRKFIDLTLALMVNPNSIITMRRYAAAILTKLVNSGQNSGGGVTCYGFQIVHEAFRSSPDAPYTKLIEQITDNDIETQVNSLMLLNALFKNAQGIYMDEFMAKLEVMTRKAIIRLMTSTQKEDVGRELVTFQRLYYKELQRRHKVPIDLRNKNHSDIWNEIYTTADIKSGGIQQLGFRTNSLEQEIAPVGLLGLESMAHFVKKDKDFFAKFILEQNSRNDGRRLRFATASIEITRALMEHFQIVNDEYANRCPMVLAFEDMFIVCMQGLIRMWKEMDATENDMSKVVALVRTQIEFTSKDPEAMIDQYRTALLNTPVKDVQARLLENLEAGDDVLMKVPVRTLRERLHKEAYQFVQDQRVSVMLRGAFFANYTHKGKTRNSYRFYKLSPNKRYLHYGEYTDNSGPKPTLDLLNEKIELSSVAELAVAGTSPMFQDKRKVSDEVPVALTFSLVSHDGASLADFVAESTTQYNEWTDGLRVVLGKALATGSANRETLDFIDNLTDFDVKVKLLQLRIENVTIPDEPPPIPPPPSSYDFYYNV